MEIKKCTSCGEQKSIERFSKDRSKKDGLRCQCKECAKNQNAKRNETRRTEGKSNPYSREHYQANRDAALKRSRNRYAKNKAAILSKQREYRAANQERRALKLRKWKAANADKVKVIAHRYRSRRSNAVGVCTAEQMKARFCYYGNKCIYCGCVDNLTVEHLIPLSRNGTNWPANIAPSCSSCNSSKGAKTHAEFLSCRA